MYIEGEWATVPLSLERLGAPTTMHGEPTRPQTLGWNGRSCLLAFNSQEKAVLQSVSNKATMLQIPPGMKWLRQGELRGRSKVTLPYSPGPMCEPNEDTMDVKVKLPGPSYNRMNHKDRPHPTLTCLRWGTPSVHAPLSPTLEWSSLARFPRSIRIVDISVPRNAFSGKHLVPSTSFLT